MLQPPLRRENKHDVVEEEHLALARGSEVELAGILEPAVRIVQRVCPGADDLVDHCSRLQLDHYLDTWYNDPYATIDV